MAEDVGTYGSHTKLTTLCMNGALLQATHTAAMPAAAASAATTRQAALAETLRRSGMRLAKSTR